MFNSRENKVDNYTITNISHNEKDIATSLSIKQARSITQLLNQIEELDLSKSELNILIECIKHLTQKAD